MKVVVAAFNQEKALVGAFSVITNLRMQLFEALVLGGFVIGVLGGAAVSFVTAHTHGSREVEPLLVFATAYISFVTAELVHWSGIISIIGFGVVVKRYAMVNVSKKSYTTIKYATRNVFSSCKTSKKSSPIIFYIYNNISGIFVHLQSVR